MFVELVGVTKAQGSVEYPMLEYCIREDLKLKVKRMMAILDPVKLVIDNYPEGQTEYMEVSNNQENPEMGTRKFHLQKNYILREKTSWRNHLRSTSDYSQVMKCVL